MSCLTLIFHWLFVSGDVKHEFEILQQAILSVNRVVSVSSILLLILIYKPSFKDSISKPI
jgi:hypothetical protein